MATSGTRTNDGRLDSEVHDGQRSTASGETDRISHYPLDIPLPFERYEHRRLGARDIMVHRIMADFMNPSRLAGGAYDSRNFERAAFESMMFQDYELSMDWQVLHKMLFTSYVHDVPPPGAPTTFFVLGPDGAIRQIVWQPPKLPPTLGSRVLDLVQRYYFETDDSAFRLVTDRLRPPRAATGPRTATRYGADDDVNNPRSRGRRAREFNHLLSHQQMGQNKLWMRADMKHLRGFRAQVSTQDEYTLYDGASFLPSLRRPLDRDANGQSGSRPSPEGLHWTMSTHYLPRLSPFSFPAERPLARLIPQTAWSRLGGGPLDRPGNISLDLVPNTGRGRTTDGTWATASRDKLPSAHETGEDEAAGRPGRRRRRADSEPPPGSFAVAGLPTVGVPGCSVTYMRVMYPRMKLSQLDRRSRRRSLSRTRVAEMFDWSVDLAATKGDSPTTSSASTSGGNTATGQDAIPVPGSSAPASSKQKPKGHGPCANCGERSHRTRDCTGPCGHCGAPNPGKPTLRPPKGPGKHGNPHLAPTCPLPRASRCKCGPFPTYHSSTRCPVRCARRCGNPLPRGSFNHRNAMTCRARCCMCGIGGGSHSGRECRLRACRCGGAHLGQDCGWKVECRVRGCGRFLCGAHCQGCGEKARPLVEGRCSACRGEEEAGGVVQEDAGVAKGRRRRGKAKHHPSLGEERGSDPVEKQDPNLGEERSSDPLEKLAVQPEAERGDGKQEGYKSLFGPFE